ncbi:membrane protein insertase YidC [Sphingomonas sp.]|uniref:membrane protein insertase YidC n=1 Tax=Sphingomonas sp. TaxID=28214 RepID=UPI003CC543AC
MTEERRNFILFAVIAAVILLSWQWAIHRYAPANPPATQIVDGRSRPVASPAADPTADSPAATRTRAQVLAATAGERVRIDTPALSGSINLRGARIDDLVLKRHRETIASDSPPIRLFSPDGAPQASFAQLGWRGGPGPETLWRASSTVLAPGRPVTLFAVNSAGQRFRIELAIDDDYLFTVRQTVANASAAAVQVAPNASIVRVGVAKDLSSWQSHVGPIGVFGSGANYDIDYKNLQGNEPGIFSRIFGTTAKPGDNLFAARGGWVGFTDKYWLTALVPAATAQVQSGFRATTTDRFTGGFTLADAQLPPGKALISTARLFAGAKETRLLDRYAAAGVTQLDYAIDWGWFRVVEKPIFYYLDWLFRVVGNFGVAIILLTVTIRALMFPVAQRQFASMAKMRVVQPKMKAVQERWKDDKERMQKEVIALYKTEGANPVAGCLPTLLQIPIFYALYKVLSLTIEMRHQPFVAWIKDLSAPDPLTPINLFGLLPFTPPGMLHLGVLAILLGGTMWAQFRLNPAAPDPATQQVMGIMPWVMMLFFAPLAAGLQLYYVMSNLISIGQQRLLYRRHPQLKEAPAK